MYGTSVLPLAGGFFAGGCIVITLYRRKGFVTQRYLVWVERHR